MKLISFSVKNFRSITTAKKINVDGYTLLVGANNEGKSNILLALKLGMASILAMSSGRLGVQRLAFRRQYDWEKDFPLSKQGSTRGQKTTELVLEFQLTEDEVEEFKSEIKSNLNGTLPISVTLGNDTKAQFSIKKPGRGNEPLNRKAETIAKFVSERIIFEYIPAIRTATSARRVIRDLLETELSELENNEAYRQAVKKIQDLQQPVLDDLSRSVAEDIKRFLPNVEKVEIEAQSESRFRSLRRDVDVLVDDGNLTDLERKGDGVQSMVALSLMKHIADKRAKTQSSIIAIEEPESHLHPSAIHELKDTIFRLAEDSQIVVTSHSPIFVNRESLRSNILVRKSVASPAKSYKELRETLGVRFSDNLMNASLVLLVEGPDDREFFLGYFKAASNEIHKSISNGRLIIAPLYGASKLSQQANFYVSNACSIHAFLDNDSEANVALKAVQESKLINDSELHQSAKCGRNESELEDLYDLDFYSDTLKGAFDVDLSALKSKRKKLKWSAWVKVCFETSGKRFNDKTKEEVKKFVNELACKSPLEAISKEGTLCLESLVSALEGRI